MPSDVTMPDGAIITNVPDGTTKAQLQAKYGAHLAQTEPNTAVDVARSIPGALTKAGSFILGGPSDIAQFMNYGLSKAGQYLTGRTEDERLAHEAEIERNKVLPDAPTSSTIANTVAAPFGGLYKPKTTGGEYADTILSMVPGAFAPGSWLQRGARVLVPSVTSETVGQIPGIKGTWIEPYARGVAALASGVGVGAAEGIAAERAQTARTPTTEHLFTAGGHEYNRVGGTPVALNQQFMDALHGPFGEQAIQTARAGADANRRTALVAELDSLLSPTPPTHISANAAEAIRRGFGTRARQVERGTEPDENVVAGLYGRRADVDNVLTQVPEIQDARQIWGMAERGQIIDEAIEAARRSRGTPAGFGDDAQAIRREFLALTRSREFENFSPAEQHAIEAVANGTLTSNTLQRLGKFSPVKSHLTGLLELLGTSVGGAGGLALGGVTGGAAGTIPAIALATGGELARQGSNFASARAARQASELVRSGGTTAPLLAAPIGREGARALVSTDRRRLDYPPEFEPPPTPTITGRPYAARTRALAGP